MKQLKSHLIAFSTLILIASAVHAQTFNNVVVDGSSGDRSETSIAVDPNNPQLLMATWNEFSNGSYSQPGYAFSTDGGKSWINQSILAQGLNSGSYYGGYDPSCAIDHAGDERYAFVNQYGIGSNEGAVDIEYSTDNGQSWNGSDSLLKVSARALSTFDFSSATSAAKGVLKSSDATLFQKHIALVRLSQAFLTEGSQYSHGYLQDTSIISDLTSHMSDNDSLSEAAEELLAIDYEASGRLSKAQSLANDLITKYSSPDVQKSELMLLVSLGSYDPPYDQASSTALKTLISRYGSLLDAGLLAAVGVRVVSSSSAAGALKVSGPAGTEAGNPDSTLRKAPQVRDRQLS